MFTVVLIFSLIVLCLTVANIYSNKCKLERENSSLKKQLYFKDAEIIEFKEHSTNVGNLLGEAAYLLDKIDNELLLHDFQAESLLETYQLKNLQSMDKLDTKTKIHAIMEMTSINQDCVLNIDVIIGGFNGNV